MSLRGPEFSLVQDLGFEFMDKVPAKRGSNTSGCRIQGWEAWFVRLGGPSLRVLEASTPVSKAPAMADTLTGIGRVHAPTRQGNTRSELSEAQW